MVGNIPRVLVTALGSGSGKTSLMIGLIGAIKKRYKVGAFKCGPDYIDPMFHSITQGICSYNIDLFLSNNNTIKEIILESGCDFALIEGVMGYYDGINFTDKYSSHHIAMELKSPAILIINAKGMSATLPAVINGILGYKPNNIKGVILNRVNKMTYSLYKEMIERECGIKVLGFLEDMKDVSIESRHLGLVCAGEIENIESIINKLVEAVEECIDIDSIINIAESAEPLSYIPIEIEKKQKVKIGITKDKAFSFLYESNIELLKKAGVEIEYISPLKDMNISNDISGLIITGGYPEKFKEKLSGNISFIKSLQEKYKHGLPIIAECGGYMYISESIDNISMAGLIDCKSSMTERLQNFGYINIVSAKDSLLFRKGEQVAAHEFHYSKMDKESNHLDMVKPNGRRKWQGAYVSDTIYAGYPHIYFYADINMMYRFIDKAVEYSRKL